MLAKSRSHVVCWALVSVCGCDAEEPPAQTDVSPPETGTRVEESPTPELPTRPAASSEEVAQTGLVGRGSGAGFGGRGQRVPQVRQAKAEITGALERDQVRKVVREHINEIRSCYNSGLTPCPNLNARVAIEFVIEPNGKVGSAEVVESTQKDTKLPACIVEAVQGWRFPKPKDGKPVTVVYPFALSPG
jgi:TonB family protein